MAYRVGSNINTKNTSSQDKLGGFILLLANDPRRMSKSKKYVTKLIESVAVSIKQLKLL